MSYKVFNVSENITLSVKLLSQSKNIFHIVQNEQGLVGTITKFASKIITNEKHNDFLKFSLRC